MKKKKNLILIIIGLILIFLYFFYVNEPNYVEKFEQVDGVIKATNFLNYEGKTQIDLQLKNGGFISLQNFDKTIFSNTKHVILNSIGASEITCFDKRNTEWHISGFNLVKFIDINYPSLKVKNIFDIVDNYDDLYKYIIEYFGDFRNKKEIISEEILCGLDVYDKMKNIDAH